MHRNLTDNFSSVHVQVEFHGVFLALNCLFTAFSNQLTNTFICEIDITCKQLKEVYVYVHSYIQQGRQSKNITLGHKVTELLFALWQNL